MSEQTDVAWRETIVRRINANWFKLSNQFKTQATTETETETEIKNN